MKYGPACLRLCRFLDGTNPADDRAWARRGRMSNGMTPCMYFSRTMTSMILRFNSRPRVRGRIARRCERQSRYALGGGRRAPQSRVQTQTVAHAAAGLPLTILHLENTSRKSHLLTRRWHQKKVFAWRVLTSLDSWER